ncbi:MAG: tRNA (guanosine(37)-N1)-methyltransferase TrmD [Phycisphaerales bacterium]|nr:tRNA (guanosine(37)-N1)-methyltransferase TrmD [Phycisphaerales bacterium]
MRIDILTLFPEMFAGAVSSSILKRAQDKQIVGYHLHQLRDYTNDPHKKVDDRPFGGGPGMVLMCQPVIDAVVAIEAMDSRPATRVLLAPTGEKLTQKMAEELSKLPRLLLVAGHYEGFDERIHELLKPREISIGDFILSGGEVPAMVILDAVVRLIPGVLGHDDSPRGESFGVCDPTIAGGLEYPHYTRPREFRGLSVPEVLLSGDHGAVEAWRREQAQRRTAERRPDLLSSSRQVVKSSSRNVNDSTI